MKAWRFAIGSPEIPADVRVVESELTSFTLPPNARGWMQPYHAAGPYTPAYEDFFFPVSPGDPPPDSRQKAVGWAFPALFHVPDAATWVLLTEAGTDESYCACHLNPDCSSGIYRIAFPLADETTRGYTNQFGPEPRYTLPWTMPWRVMVLGKSAGDIATGNPRHGSFRAVAHRGHVVDQTRSRLVGLVVVSRRAGHGGIIQSSSPISPPKWAGNIRLFDAGWWKPGLKPIAAHALAEGVMPLAWNYAADFYDPKKRASKLDEMAAAGIRGVKVDFWCSDRQEAIAAQQALMRDARGAAHDREPARLHDSARLAADLAESSCPPKRCWATKVIFTNRATRKKRRN